MNALLVPEWPEVPDPTGVIPSCYQLRYSEDLGLVAVWSPEHELHISFRSNGSCPLESLQIAVALLDRICTNATVH